MTLEVVTSQLEWASAKEHLRQPNHHLSHAKWLNWKYKKEKGALPRVLATPPATSWHLGPHSRPPSGGSDGLSALRPRLHQIPRSTWAPSPLISLYKLSHSNAVLYVCPVPTSIQGPLARPPLFWSYAVIYGPTDLKVYVFLVNRVICYLNHFHYYGIDAPELRSLGCGARKSACHTSFLLAGTGELSSHPTPYEWAVSFADSRQVGFGFLSSLKM